MRVMVLGASGLIGSHVAEHLTHLGHEVEAPAHNDVDVLDIGTLQSALAGNVRRDKTAIDALVNCVAYTNTDKAEDEPGQARLLNADAAGNVAKTCYRRQVRLIHLSTELVLGSSPDPQFEDAPIKPIGVYARTKADGEDQVMNQTDGKAVVVRTCSVYGHGGRNWSSSLAAKLLKGEQIKADAGRRTWPNSAIEVSRQVGKVLAHPILSGIYHASGSGPMTWFDWCQRLAINLGRSTEQVRWFKHQYRVERPEVMLASRYEMTMRATGEQLMEYAQLVREVGP